MYVAFKYRFTSWAVPFGTFLWVSVGSAGCTPKNEELKVETGVQNREMDNKGHRDHKNRLASEKSPYLLQHATNPVDWFTWGDEAFHLARKEDKPVFLSIGYSTCHWWHVMEREPFEDE